MYVCIYAFIPCDKVGSPYLSKDTGATGAANQSYDVCARLCVCVCSCARALCVFVCTHAYLCVYVFICHNAMENVH